MVVSTLPPDEADYLRSLRTSLPLLRCRVASLRAASWTLRAIGEPLQVGRSTVRAWEHAVTSPCLPFPAEAPPLPSPPNLRPAPPLTPLSTPASPAHSHTIRAMRPDVPSLDALRIAQLAPLARKVRGGTPADSPYRSAKTELGDLVAQYRARGVSIQRLATLAGVTYRAMRVRLSERDAA